jgi:hypothetical protein
MERHKNTIATEPIEAMIVMIAYLGTPFYAMPDVRDREWNNVSCHDKQSDGGDAALHTRGKLAPVEAVCGGSHGGVSRDI